MNEASADKQQRKKKKTKQNAQKNFKIESVK